MITLALVLLLAITAGAHDSLQIDTTCLTCQDPHKYPPTACDVWHEPGYICHYYHHTTIDTVLVEHEDREEGFKSWGTYYALPRGKYLRLNTNYRLITLPREVDTIVCVNVMDSTWMPGSRRHGQTYYSWELRSVTKCDTTWKEPVIRLEEIKE